MIGLTPHNKDLRLIGGGHSHIAVIKRFGMKPLPGVRVTLISGDTMTAYSGMLPGLIAGHYVTDDCHIDLRKLCQWAGVQFIRSEVTHIDPGAKRIDCRDYPPLRYDVLSIDVGSQPALASIEGADRYGCPVKPVGQFLQQWQRWQSSATPDRVQRIVVAGGGAAGVEIVLALRHRLTASASASIRAEFTLICADAEILGTHNERVRHYFRQHLQTLGVRVICSRRVACADAHRLTLDDQTQLDYDFAAWAIHAGAQSWPAQSGLACDAHSFIQVDRYLRSVSHSDIFAAGDCAAFTPHPLPKAGVYAVRQGPVLTGNLIAQLQNRPLQPFKPQQLFLSLLTTGDRHAVASRGAFFASGQWVWHWKDFIDRRFMARFNPKSMPSTAESGDTEPMRCGGCGAKIGSDILHDVLAQLDIRPRADVVNALGDDAAIIDLPAQTRWLQSVDFFRSFIDDPYLLGRIAAIHSLSDIYAMGGVPHSALVTAVIPHGDAAIVREKLLHLMQGVLSVLDREDTALIGGHSGEGPEMAVGLTVNGTLPQGAAFTKSGLKPGDCLILTKPIGSGVLLAANMAARCRGIWLDDALAIMQQSNRAAAEILRAFAVQGCTDVTGFGLLGHLQEMLLASRCSATLLLDAIPVMDGAQSCSAQGIKSTLYPHNRQAARCRYGSSNHRSHDLLFDPQTAGGLLAGVPAVTAQACLQALREAGYSAAVVGEVVTVDAEALIVLR